MASLPSPMAIFVSGAVLAVFAALGIWFGGCVPLIIWFGE